MQNREAYLINPAFMAEVIGYLKTKPYIEVVGFLDQLKEVTVIKEDAIALIEAHARRDGECVVAVGKGLLA